MLLDSGTHIAFPPVHNARKPLGPTWHLGLDPLPVEQDLMDVLSQHGVSSGPSFKDNVVGLARVRAVDPSEVPTRPPRRLRFDRIAFEQHAVLVLCLAKLEEALEGRQKVITILEESPGAD